MSQQIFPASGVRKDPRHMLWLDCDPGHDDAIAILMALYEPSVELIGISTVHGNASLSNTTINAARCLEAFGAPHLQVHPGANKPLIGTPLPSVDIHGNDGLGGVEGLPAPDDPAVLARIACQVEGEALPAIEGLRKAALNALDSGRKICLGVTGSATNAAIFILSYPHLAKRAIAQIVAMGGGVGLGNVTASAEFNIYIDPEAAQIVFDSEIPIYSIPLNVTHQVIFHQNAHRYLLNPTQDPGTHTGQPLPPAVTPLRHTLSTLLTFFAQTYHDVFGFTTAPPVHDALVVAYIANPSAFTSRLCRVDAELAGKHTRGALVVDTYDRVPPAKRNVEMAMTVDTAAVLRDFFLAVEQADQCSPLNADIDLDSTRGQTTVPSSAL